MVFAKLMRVPFTIVRIKGRQTTIWTHLAPISRIALSPMTTRGQHETRDEAYRPDKSRHPKRAQRREPQDEI